MMQKESKQQEWSARVWAGWSLSIRAWCAREGLTWSTFHYWRKRVLVPAPGPTSLIALPKLDRQEAPTLEVMTPLGYVIRVSSAKQLGWVKGLLKVLR